MFVSSWEGKKLINFPEGIDFRMEFWPINESNNITFDSLIVNILLLANSASISVNNLKKDLSKLKRGGRQFNALFA